MIRTRMAPSPTGEFHIGGMRTLLYNYAFARKNNGKFVLRIEDTDQKRYVDGAMERAMEVIKDYGLDWDEGPDVGGSSGPYIQSKRLDLYKKYALELVEKGHAYYCFCTEERLEELRKSQQESHQPNTRYDRHCLTLTKEEVSNKLALGTPYVIRLKVPEDRVISYEDILLGEVAFPSKDIDDQILLKSDGFPTYQLAVIIDDHLMGITHILRGMEWLASTPKHVLVYEFLGWEMPKTGHMPLLKEVGATKKMSKRFGDVAAAEFLKSGYLPQALLNFLMLLGWNPGTEQEIFSLEEFIKEFTLERIHKTDLVAFDREKLLWFNGYYIRQHTDSALMEIILKWAKKWEVSLVSEGQSLEYSIQVIHLVKDRMKVLTDFNELAGYFFTDPQVQVCVVSKYAGEKYSEILRGIAQIFEKADWTKVGLEKVAHDYIQGQSYGVKEAFMTLRLAVTGQEATPPLFDVLELLGKKTVLRRINSVITQNSK